MATMAWPLSPTLRPIRVENCHSWPSPPASLMPPRARTCRPSKLSRSLMLVTPASASAPYTDDAPPVMTSMLPMAICGMVLRSMAPEALLGTARRPSISVERPVHAQAAQVQHGGAWRELADARVVHRARGVEHVAGAGTARDVARGRQAGDRAGAEQRAAGHELGQFIEGLLDGDEGALFQHLLVHRHQGAGGLGVTAHDARPGDGDLLQFAAGRRRFGSRGGYREARGYRRRDCGLDQPMGIAPVRLWRWKCWS